MKQENVRWPVSRVLSISVAGNRMTIHLGHPLPDASCNQPGRRAGAPCCQCLATPQPAIPIRSCSRWGLPCQRRCRRRGALLPHRFTLARVATGGLFSVALSLGSPPPGVTRHRFSVEPGLSSLTPCGATAVIQPPDARDLTPQHGPGQCTVDRGADLAAPCRAEPQAASASRCAVSSASSAFIHTASALARARSPSDLTRVRRVTSSCGPA